MSKILIVLFLQGDNDSPAIEMLNAIKRLQSSVSIEICTAIQERLQNTLVIGISKMNYSEMSLKTAFDTGAMHFHITRPATCMLSNYNKSYLQLILDARLKHSRIEDVCYSIEIKAEAQKSSRTCSNFKRSRFGTLTEMILKSNYSSL